MDPSTIHQDLGRRLDLFEEAIAEKLDHLAEVQAREDYISGASTLLDTGSVGLVPWILLTVLITIGAVCWLFVWLTPR